MSSYVVLMAWWCNVPFISAAMVTGASFSPISSRVIIIASPYLYQTPWVPFSWGSTFQPPEIID